MFKNILSLALGLLLFQNAQASLLFEDAFTNLVGNLSAPWNGSPGSSLAVGAGSLSYPGLTDLSPPGNHAHINSGTGRTLYRSFTASPITGGAAYFSFLIACTTLPTASQYITGLLTNGATTINGSPDPIDLYAVNAAGGFQFQVSHAGVSKVTAATILTLNSIHLVVLKYTFGGGGKAELFINPTPGSAEPASADATSATNGTDAASLATVGIKSQGNSSQGDWDLDSYRLGTAWTDVVPSGVITVTNSTPYITNALLTVDEFALSGTNGTPNAFYQVVASTNLTLPQSSWPKLATNVFDARGNFDFALATTPVNASQFFRLLSPGGGTPPSIAPQPQNQTVVFGQNALFTAGAGGDSPFSYQWYFNATLLTGETNSSLTVTNAQTDDAGNYSVSVSNPFGIATSAAALLTVMVPPNIGTQPQDQTLSAGQDATFTVLAGGSAPLHYQWYFNTSTILVHATNNTVTITNIQASNAGTYSVIVTNSGGSVTSVLATLTVNTGPTAPTITTQPQDQTVTAGQNAMFTAAASGSLPLRYQWYFDTNTILNGFTNPALTITNAQTNNAGGYSVIVTNDYGSATSAVARLTLNIASTNTGMVGYVTVGYTPTGGTGGTTQTVTTATAFKTAVTSTAKMVIYVQGTLDVRSISSVNMKVGNKTIIGLGTNATILGDLGIKHSTNVIVRNIFFTNPGTGNGSGGAGDGDGITMQFAEHVWVDHCTFTDCADGECDITHASDFVTVSWCKFNYTSNALHNFVNLIGHSDNNAAEDTGKLHITFVHNWWSTLCVERMPRTRFGRVHVFNNYANSPGNNYCVRASIQSEVLVENNFYENSNSPYQYYAPNGLIRALGNKTVNCSSVGTFTDTVFTPAYAYTLETPDTAKANVLAGAGAGTSLFP